MPNPVSRRTALRYNRLRDLIGVLANALIEQPEAAAAPVTVVMINEMFALARHVFARLAGAPRFVPLPETASLSNFDMRLVVMRLNVACAAFDRQYEVGGIDEPDPQDPEDPRDDPYEGYDPAEVERFLAEDDAPVPKRRVAAAGAHSTGTPQPDFSAPTEKLIPGFRPGIILSPSRAKNHAALTRRRAGGMGKPGSPGFRGCGRQLRLKDWRTWFGPMQNPVVCSGSRLT